MKQRVAVMRKRCSSFLPGFLSARRPSWGNGVRCFHRDEDIRPKKHLFTVSSASFERFLYSDHSFRPAANKLSKNEH